MRKDPPSIMFLKRFAWQKKRRKSKKKREDIRRTRLRHRVKRILNLILCAWRYMGGLGRRPAVFAISATFSSHSIAMIWIPRTPGISLNLCIVSTQILIPSSGCFSFGTPFILSIISSGTSIPGTEFFIYRAIPTDLNGVTPANIAHPLM